MRKIFIFAMIVSLAGVASARKISENEARGIAASRVSALRSAKPVQARCVGAEDGALAPVYIFSAPKGGFAIVAGDDRMPDMVLAYSDSDAFDYDHAPSAMRAWLDEVSEYIKAGDFSKVRRSTLDYSKPVEPMVKTKWNQMWPYNNLTPIGSEGYNCPTGCVATAAAQVVNFWQYPKNGGLGAHSYQWQGQTISVDFRESRYDWANMLNEYDRTATEAQCNAVAKLMLDCGVACDMDYGNESSGAFEAYLVKGLIDYFGFNPGMRLCYRIFYTNDEWFAMVKSSLDAGMPLVYGGVTNGLEGHAFVCDGYDSNGLYHINWGWGGMSDGYFNLDILDPDQQGTGGAHSGAGFTREQKILFDMRPPKEGDVADNGWVLCVDDINAYPGDKAPGTFEITWEVGNQGGRPFEGELGVSIWHESEPEEEEYMAITTASGADALVFNHSRGLSLSGDLSDELKDGKYYMRFLATPLGSEDMIEMLTPAASRPVYFEIRNGEMVDTRPHLVVSNPKLNDLNFYFTTDVGLRCTISNFSFDLSNTSETTFTNGIYVNWKYVDGILGDTESRGHSCVCPKIAHGQTIHLEMPMVYNVNGPLEIGIDNIAEGTDKVQKVGFEGNKLKFDINDFYRELEFTAEPTAEVASGKVTIKANVTTCTGSTIDEKECVPPEEDEEIQKT